MRYLLSGSMLVATGLCVALSLSQARHVQAEETTTGGSDEAGLTARIDSEIGKVWKRDGVKPVGQCGDDEFLRRVYLDTVGVPPTYEEAVAFLDSTDKHKRDQLIDKLVADPRFGQHMADQWTVLLTPRRGEALSGSHLLAIWLADEINAGTGFNTIIREIVTARGELADNPAVIPYFGDGEGLRITDLIGKLSKNLYGVQVQCAECHDHPYDETLTQESFQGMAAFMAATQARVDNKYVPARVSVKDDPSIPQRVLAAYKIYDKLKPEQQAQVDLYINYVRPVTLDGQKIDTRDPGVWRDKLAAWMLADDNPQTRRYVANRFWSIAFGSGLVNPVDDFNPLNEASHPELLNALGDDLKDHNWDVKRLYRAILKSRTWQLSAGDPPKQAERWHFAAHTVRPLTPEQFLGALIGLLPDAQVDDVVSKGLYAGIEKAKADLKARQAADKKQGKSYYTYDLATLNRYGEKFESMDPRWYIARWGAGRYASLSNDDEMNQSEDFTMSIVQALAVMNGEFTNALSAAGKDSLLERITKHFETGVERVDALYLMVLSRRPSKAEAARVLQYVSDNKDATKAAEDLLFALLMTTEFATNH